MKVFISHSSYDKWVARQISTQLESSGHTTFLDEKDIKTGDSIDASIQEHLKDSDHLLIVISPASLKSHWVFIEIGGAKALGKKIIPILFHVQANEIPGAITQLLARDINDIDAYYKELSPADQKAKSRLPSRPPTTRKILKQALGFEVGDTIRLAQVEHLTEEDREEAPKWTKGMEKYSGAVGTITEIARPDAIRLSVDGGEYWWSSRWFTKEA